MLYCVTTAFPLRTYIDHPSFNVSTSRSFHQTRASYIPVHDNAVNATDAEMPPKQKVMPTPKRNEERNFYREA
jgi:hypothetical protein